MLKTHIRLILLSGFLGMVSWAQGQTIQLELDAYSACVEELSVDIWISTSDLLDDQVQIGSSTIFLNYEGGEIQFREYIPAEFDASASAQAAEALWEDQVYDINEEYGIFHLVLHKNEGGNNNYILQKDLPPIKIGTLIFDQLALGEEYQFTLNRQFSTISNAELAAEEEALFLEEMPALTLSPSAIPYREDFQDLAKRVGRDEGESAWSVDATATNPNAKNYFMGTWGRRYMMFKTLEGEAVWRSEWIDVCSDEAVNISLDVWERGTMEEDDYIRVYYEALGEEEVLIGAIEDDLEGRDRIRLATPQAVKGEKIRVVARVKNGHRGNGERFYMDNIQVERYECEVGTPCDDGDVCTENDQWQADCSCAGTPLPDTDEDGTCDIADICTNFDDALIGTPCDDGNACTTNDTWQTSCDCVGIPEDLYVSDFEEGWGIWKDGGKHAHRAKNKHNAQSGDYSARIRNDTETSVITTETLDFSIYEEFTLAFSYITRGIEGGETFVFEVSTDGGENFQVVDEWEKGVDFENKKRNQVTIKIPGPFSDNTQLRFRAQASDNSDKVFIDDIVISACPPASLESPVSNFTATPVQGQTPFGVHFNASNSFEPAGKSLTYLWDFGDGSQGQGEFATHVFPEAGRYAVTLTLLDENGRTSQKTQEVMVDAQGNINQELSKEPAGGSSLVPVEQVNPKQLNLLEELGIKVYPNPFEESISLEIVGSQRKFTHIEVRVLDMLGKEVYRKANISPQGKITLGESLVPGLYILRLTLEDTHYDVKIHKQR